MTNSKCKALFSAPIGNNRYMEITVSNDTTQKLTDTDQYQERVLRRVWLAIIRDTWPEPLYRRLQVCFGNEKNISQLIQWGSDVADYVVYGLERPNNPFMFLADYCNLHDPVHVRKLLATCRFAKRYTPQLPVGVSDFWETNDRVGRWDPEEHKFIVSALRQIISEDFANYCVNWDEWTLTSGSTVDHDKSVVDKIYSVERVYPSLMGISLGTPYWNMLDGSKEPYYYNKIVRVPKNYKKSRNIAMEPQWLSVRAQPIAKAIERCLPAMCDLSDQSTNMNLARTGSIDNSLVTIDCSAASDSISRKLCQAVLPEAVYNDIISATSKSERPRIDRWGRPKTYYDPVFGTMPSTREYNMVCTMGNRITFPLECEIFSAILRLAAELCSVKVGSYNSAVYGDDIIAPREIAPTLISLLEAFGFVVNADKSFYGDEFFRESCGGEYFHGESVTTQYWPRKALSKRNALPSLVSLQHDWYKFPYTDDVLRDEIRKLCPKITESYIGSPYDDIWSAYPQIKPAYSSYANGSKDQVASCEIHTMLEPERGCVEWSEALDRYNYYTFLKYGHQDHEDPVLAAVGYPADRDSTWGAVHPDVSPKNRKFLL